MLEVNFDPFPILETNRLILRKIILEDADDYFEMRNNVDTMKYICKPVQTSVEETKEKILRINDMINFNDGIGWAVCLKTNNQMIGTISFHKLIKEHYRAELGYMLNPKFWKQGITTEAVKVVIDFGFNQMHLHSIEAHIDPANKGSEKLLQKCTFTREAYFKENYYFNGKFLDTAVFSLINPF
ncbi:MAG: GNAT family N-acetyltransferase [Burkholderiales bacterium]|nr:GNAT family N-acetyltransferase [Bacteroidia bacterium]